MNNEDGNEVPEDENAPEPSASTAGVEGTQREKSSKGSGQLVVVPQEADQKHLGAVLHNYSETRSPVLAAVAVAAYQDAINRLNAAEYQKEHFREQYHRERELRIASENRTAGRGALTQFKEYCFGVGGILAGIGVTILVAESETKLIGGLVAGVGLVLMVLGAPFFHKDH